MAEVVKAWGRKYSVLTGGFEAAEKEAAENAENAVEMRMRSAGLRAIDDVAIVKTERKNGMVRCQAAVRAVR